MDQARIGNYLFWALMGLLVIVLVRTAWVCDDAFITLRCVDNAAHGYAFSFNTTERVQAFTHPLWALLLLPIHAVLNSGYYELIFIGIACCVAAMLVARRHLPAAVMPLLILGALASKAWVEYGTSGLENSLSYLVLTLFVVQWWRQAQTGGRLFHMSLWAGLLLMNRMDLALLVAPALAVAFWRARSWHALKQVALGMAPFLLWEAWAVIYYGFPFPNTAYAKLGNALPRYLLDWMGWGYFLDAWQRDPILLLVIAGGMLAGFLGRRDWPLAVGMLLYVVYVQRIGGDFMSGRFLSVPFWCGLLLVTQVLARMPLATWRSLGLAGVVTVVGLLGPTPMLLSGRKNTALPPEKAIGETGVADERAFFYAGTGLLNVKSGSNGPVSHEWSRVGMDYKSQRPQVWPAKVIGMVGFYAGPQQVLVDQHALSDPLLARLPALYRQLPRAGHFLRVVPEGYFESCYPPRNLVRDPILRPMWDDLDLATRGPLFTWRRWKAIYRLNFEPIPLAQLQYYRAPHRQSYSLEPGQRLDFDIVNGNAAYVALPAGTRHITFAIARGGDGCDAIWMRGGTPIGGFGARENNTYVVRKGFGADGVIFHRESYPMTCKMRGLRLGK